MLMKLTPAGYGHTTARRSIRSPGTRNILMSTAIIYKHSIVTMATCQVNIFDYFLPKITVKPVNNNHPQNRELVAIVDKWYYLELDVN